MTDELRSQADVASWLAAGLAVRRIAPDPVEPVQVRERHEPPEPPAPSDDEVVGAALLACAAELAELPPAGVIADVATLLAGARPVLRGRAPDREALRSALVAYDDDVLGRLIATPRFDDLLAACAHAAPADRPAATALVIGALCERTRFTGVAVSPAALRRALAAPRDERFAAGGAAQDRLADAYLRLARGARLCSSLIHERDVFAVDHLGVLRDLGGRMTAAHIAAAAAAIAQRLPRRLPARRALGGARDTRLADDALFPAGGFASITPGGATTGNLANLVVSELVYMDDREPVDLFSLRYVEGELLHYARDDSELRRHRHAIAVGLAADLDGARVKDRDLPWQRLILALGLVIAAIRWLADQLGDQALTIELGFPAGALAEERAIVALLLGAELARGTVAIAAQPWHDWVDRTAASLGTASAIADVVVISLGDPPELPRGLRAVHLQLAGPSPIVRELAPRAAPDTDLTRDPPPPWTAWCEAAEDLLRWLV